MNRIVKVIGSRPSKTPDGREIPAGWTIYNATRPLMGLDWTSNFIHGVFFAAADPEDYMTRTRNFNLDACILEYASEQEVIDFSKTVCVAEYPDCADLPFDQYREWFIDKFIEYYNYQPRKE